MVVFPDLMAEFPNLLYNSSDNLLLHIVKSEMCAVWHGNTDAWRPVFGM